MNSKVIRVTTVATVEVVELEKEQRQAIQAFVKRQDAFVACLTGYGKFS